MMFGVRRLALNTMRAPVAKRQMSTEVRSLHGYRDKTLAEAWTQDKGAWPVMSVIVVAVVFSLSWGTHYMFTHPDARISKSSRSSIFKGELKGVN